MFYGKVARLCQFPSWTLRNCTYWIQSTTFERLPMHCDKTWNTKSCTENYFRTFWRRIQQPHSNVWDFPDEQRFRHFMHAPTTFVPLYWMILILIHTTAGTWLVEVGWLCTTVISRKTHFQGCVHRPLNSAQTRSASFPCNSCIDE